MKKFLALGLVALIFSFSASANDSNRQGEFTLESYSEQASTVEDSINFAVLDSLALSLNDRIDRVNNPRIRRLLRRESTTRTVSEAMNVKRSGLRFVRDMYDFRDLSLNVFNNPSDAYRDARSDFINQNVEPYLRHYMNFSLISELEEGMRRINDVISLKRKAVNYVSNMLEFNDMLAVPFRSPSKALLESRDEFIGMNVRDIPVTRIQSNDLFMLARELERKTKKIFTSLAVKRALYRHTNNLRQFYQVSLIELANPSDNYVQQNSEQISTEVGRYIQPSSRVRTILRIEGLTKKVNQAMRVKEAGLVAVRNNPNAFWNLTEYAFRSPSSAYRQAVNRFIDRYADQYGK